jgi:hypothetical protein
MAIPIYILRARSRNIIRMPIIPVISGLMNYAPFLLFNKKTISFYIFNAQNSATRTRKKTKG